MDTLTTSPQTFIDPFTGKEVTTKSINALQILGVLATGVGIPLKTAKFSAVKGSALSPELAAIKAARDSREKLKGALAVSKVIEAKFKIVDKGVSKEARVLGKKLLELLSKK